MPAIATIAALWIDQNKTRGPDYGSRVFYAVLSRVPPCVVRGGGRTDLFRFGRAENFLQYGNDLHDFRVGQRIIDGLRFPAGFHQSIAAQAGQML